MFLSHMHQKYIRKRAKERIGSVAANNAANTVNDSSNLFWNSPDYFKLFEATNYNFSFGGNNSSPYNNYMDNIGALNGNNGSAGSNSSSAYVNSNNSQTFQYLIDVGAHNNNINNNVNDSAKQTFDTGSSFMLLLEDFGEYFYNYNGSANVSSNNVTFEFPTNCSSANSTCPTEDSGKLWLDLAQFSIRIENQHVCTF